jgi:hypothetical protein
MSAMTEGVPRVHSASITLLSPEANLHGQDARATWHGHLAHAAHISSKARCLRHAIKT